MVAENRKTHPIYTKFVTMSPRWLNNGLAKLKTPAPGRNNLLAPLRLLKNARSMPLIFDSTDEIRLLMTVLQNSFQSPMRTTPEGPLVLISGVENLSPGSRTTWSPPLSTPQMRYLILKGWVPVILESGQHNSEKSDYPNGKARTRQFRTMLWQP